MAEWCRGDKGRIGRSVHISYLISRPQSASTILVAIPQEIKDSLRKFRFARRSAGHAAIVIKINKAKLVMEEVEQFDNISVEELAEELPENSPRYVVLSYELIHKDGRKSFPLVLINWSPSSSETGMLTLHASALLNFQNTADVSKVIEVRDGPEALTTDEINAKLLGQ
ncbi:hypothetical protein HYPSUDRAFT_39085 [Hypholoma sublateritium FD-334 SS-4]|uniref:ADF-H domain-containing protein n=1 Tax=Hypholoma sublateritium (strain FD-334 SS-4) TaxID=945553 RepID=A0A0D2MKP4_HYPSF|nr:hypothetical protein HYPSUDRAFT_39085 [Hypholoma sublateritium FD-334 SS-4]